MQHDSIKDYCDKVCEQIRWKKAKPIISTEIENHLCDQRDAYISDGDDENSATLKAILQMGDAITVGQQLNKTHKPKSQWLLFAIIGIFIVMGAIANAYLKDITDIYNNFNIITYIVAFGIVVLCYYIDFTVLGKYPKKIYAIVFIISIALVLSPNKSGSMFNIQGFSISLSYLSLIFPLAFSLFVYSMRNKGMMGILKSGIAYLPFAWILFTMPFMTGFILYTITSLIVLCFTISRGWFGVDKKQGVMYVLLTTLIISLLFLTTLVRSSYMPYILYRLSIFINPAQDSLGAGYVHNTIRGIISEASFYGEGGAINITETLPNISTDYSLVYFIHEFGFVILFTIMCLLVIFAGIGIYKAMKEKSMLGGGVALTIILTFIFQTCSYILANLGCGPLFSFLSLPFLSFGNTSLFINSALIGFMLSVFRTGEIFKDYSF